MKKCGKFIIFLSILFGVVLCCQIISYFGVKLGIGIISLLLMGGISLSLVMSGNNGNQEDLFMEEFLEDFRKN